MKDQQEFKETFNPKARTTPVELVQFETERLSSKLESELSSAAEREDYETAEALRKLKIEVESVNEEACKLSTDDVTDSKYQIEDKKRRLAQEIDNATKGKRISEAKSEYLELKDRCFKLIDSNGNDYEMKVYNDIIAQEGSFMSSNSAIRIREKSDELNAIISTILWRTPDFLTSVFNNLSQKTVRMNDQAQAKALIEAGRFAADSKNWNRLREINSGLINLLPKSVQAEITTKIGF